MEHYAAMFCRDINRDDSESTITLEHKVDDDDAGQLIIQDEHNVDDAGQLIIQDNPGIPTLHDGVIIPFYPSTFTTTDEQMTQLGKKELSIHSSDYDIGSYFRLSRHVFHISSPEITDILHIFPLHELEISARRVALSIAFLTMKGFEMYENVPKDSETAFGSNLDDFSHVIGSMRRRSTEMSNVARMWFAFRSHKPPPVLYHSPDDVELLNNTNLKPHQKLLEFVKQRASDARLRIHNKTELFRPVHLNDGTNTCFFTHYMSTREFLMYSVTPVDRYAEQYNALTNAASTPGFVTSLFSEMGDSRVPQLVINRNLFSFRNGIFNTASGIFSPYHEASYEESSARFFDVDMDQHNITCDPMSICTPCFDKILQDQDYDDHAIYWMHVMCGRLLHNVGTMDDWQICPFIRGVAGSGKSTILKVMKMMYEDNNVGALMSDGQPTFSDEHLYDKFMVIAMDLDKNVQISNTRINSMISGEELSVNRKFKLALNCKWVAPIIMASNSQPPFKDVAGNITRRFCIFLFNNSIRYSDPQLFSKLKIEVPVLLVKMSRMYLDAVRKYGNRGLWEPGILPKIVHQAKRQYLVTTNPISAFLESEWIHFGPGMRTSSSDFKKFLVQFAKELGDKRVHGIGVLSKVDHGHLFAMYGCELKEDKTEKTRRIYINGMSIRPPTV